MHKQEQAKAHEKKQLRSFGLILGVGLLVVCYLILPFTFGLERKLWPAIVASVLIIAAVTVPGLLSIIYTPWMTFGAILGRVNTFIILALVFLFIVTPIGWLKKLFSRTDSKIDEQQTFKKYAPPRDIKHLEKPY